MFFIILGIFIIAQVVYTEQIDHIDIDYNQFKERLDLFFDKEALCDYYSDDLVYGIIILWDEEEQESIISLSSVGDEFNSYKGGFQVKGVFYHNNHKFFVRISDHDKTQDVYSHLFRVIGTHQIEYRETKPEYSLENTFAYETFIFDFNELKSLGSTHNYKCGIQ